MTWAIEQLDMTCGGHFERSVFSSIHARRKSASCLLALQPSQTHSSSLNDERELKKEEGGSEQMRVTTFVYSEEHERSLPFQQDICVTHFATPL